MARPIHFEVFAADPEAMAAFYERAFGWTVTSANVPGDRPDPEGHAFGLLQAAG
jgi:predicted enzyme related to lactoylglutathione lyase